MKLILTADSPQKMREVIINTALVWAKDENQKKIMSSLLEKNGKQNDENSGDMNPFNGTPNLPDSYYTLDKAKEVFKNFYDKYGANEARELLKTFKINRISELPSEYFEKFITVCKVDTEC